MKKNFLFLVTCLILQLTNGSAASVIDSLKSLLDSRITPQQKTDILISLSNQYSYSNPDSGILYSNIAIEEAKKINDKIQLTNAFKTLGVNYYMLNDYSNALKLYFTSLNEAQKLNDNALVSILLGNIGVIYYEQGDYKKALDYYNEALTIDKELNNKKGIAMHLGNIGLVHWQQSDYPKALFYFFEALKIDEAINNKNGIARHLGNIGLLQWNQHNNYLALNYFFKALKLDTELGNINGIARHFGNIGIIYDELHDFVKAKQYYLKALEIDKKLGNKEGISRHLGNIGTIYFNQREYENALDHYYRALEISKEIGKTELETENLLNIGHVYSKTNKISEAENYLLRALMLADSLGLKERKMIIEQSLFKLYSASEQWEKAVNLQSAYMSTRDSIFNMEKSKQIGKIEAKQEYEKQEALVKQEHKAEKKQQNIIITAVSICLSLVVIFSIALYKRFRISRIQSKIIEIHKNVLEEKNRETTESIQYAKRIQQAIFPPHKYIKQLLKEHFILFKPKDIVAGDFYWVEKSGNNILFAVADCTGHGVPGALVSVMCSNALTKAVTELGLSKPSEILDKTVEIMEEQFSKSEEDLKDGMDIALCCYAINEKKIYYAGANNPLYFISNNKLEEIKADKQPIGKHISRKPFTNHSIDVKTGDCFYIFSDGYADQFGGEKEKKFKYSAFKKLLLDNYHYPMEQQKTILNTTLKNWQGSLEQVDDICVLGIRIL